MKKCVRCFGVLMAVVMLAVSLSGCAKVGYVLSSTASSIGKVTDGSWKDETVTPVERDTEDKAVIEEFTAGTYAGREFKTQDDAVNYFVECYNNTKAMTATYTDKDGNSYEYYDLVGEETLSVDDILIDGESSSMLNNVVPGMVKSAFAKGVYGLPPSNNRDPLIDNINMDASDPGEYDYRKSYFKPEYCLVCNVTDNQDGTITMKIQPKAASMAARGADSQGSFFEVLKNLGETVDNLFNDYDMISWASGSTAENCTIDYRGGTGTIKIDTKTNTVVEADYEMKVYVELNHVNVTVIKNKSGALYITHNIHYPASAEYLMESKTLTKK